MLYIHSLEASQVKLILYCYYYYIITLTCIRPPTTWHDNFSEPVPDDFIIVNLKWNDIVMFFFGCHDTHHKATQLGNYQEFAMTFAQDTFFALSKTHLWTPNLTMPSNSHSQPLDIPSDSKDSGHTTRETPNDHLNRFPSPEDEMQNRVDDMNNEAQISGMCSQPIAQQKSLSMWYQIL